MTACIDESEAFQVLEIRSELRTRNISHLYDNVLDLLEYDVNLSAEHFPWSSSSFTDIDFEFYMADIFLASGIFLLVPPFVLIFFYRRHFPPHFWNIHIFFSSFRVSHLDRRCHSFKERRQDYIPLAFVQMLNLFPSMALSMEITLSHLISYFSLFMSIYFALFSSFLINNL